MEIFDKKNNFLADFSYQVLKVFALAHNYNYWVFRLIQPYLGQHILEVGCGVGNLTLYFNNFHKVTCIDKSPKYIEHMRIDHPSLEYLLADISDKEVLNTGVEKYDTVVCVNVLEHIGDDNKALVNMHKLLKSLGKLVLFVPACSFAYGMLDKKLDHYRRYDKKPLIDKILSAGFSVEKISYCNLPGLIGWTLHSRILRKKHFSVIQTLLYDQIIPMVANIENKISPPIGLSLLAVGKKL